MKNIKPNDVTCFDRDGLTQSLIPVNYFSLSPSIVPRVIHLKKTSHLIVKWKIKVIARTSSYKNRLKVWDYEEYKAK